MVLDLGRRSLDCDGLVLGSNHGGRILGGRLLCLRWMSDGDDQLLFEIRMNVVLTAGNPKPGVQIQSWISLPLHCTCINELTNQAYISHSRIPPIQLGYH